MWDYRLIKKTAIFYSKQIKKSPELHMQNRRYRNKCLKKGGVLLFLFFVAASVNNIGQYLLGKRYLIKNDFINDIRFPLTDNGNPAFFKKLPYNIRFMTVRNFHGVVINNKYYKILVDYGTKLKD